MIEEEIKTTDIWNLYEKGVAFNRLRGLYTDTDRNYRFYNGDQWQNLESGSIQPVSLNIIKPIVKYKVGTINANLWAINYSSENYEKDFREEANKACELFNKHAARVWEKDHMDYKIWKLSKQACINSEGIIFVNFQDGEPVNEIISKTDVYYGNENSEDIQNQPYIIIKSRRPISEIRKLAEENKVSEEKIGQILPDQETTEESGESAKQEVNDMGILLTKLWKENGEVYYSKSTRNVDIIESEPSGLELYPVEHFVWDSVEGSARGEGEVKYVIPNQIEINRTLMRRAMATKLAAYPKSIANTKYIANPDAINKVGVPLLTTDDATIDDVRKIFNSTTPTPISSDAEKLQDELISKTRELNGAGDVAEGKVNPEQASGRAILAVQKATEQPLTEQRQGLKRVIENIGRIWFDGWRAYSPKGKEVLEEKEVFNKVTNQTETIEEPYKIESSVIESLKVNAKVDITPKSAYDKFAIELSIENLANNGNFMNTQWLEDYVEMLDDDSVMPKQRILDLIKKRRQAQKDIAKAEIEAAKITGAMSEGINEIEGQLDSGMTEEMVQQTV